VPQANEDAVEAPEGKLLIVTVLRMRPLLVALQARTLSSGLDVGIQVTVQWSKQRVKSSLQQSSVMLVQGHRRLAVLVTYPAEAPGLAALADPGPNDVFRSRPPRWLPPWLPALGGLRWPMRDSSDRMY
jgi:hypothetical protein